MANHLRESQIWSPPEAQLKLSRVVKSLEEVKIAYHRLKDQIDDDLLQTKEVFESLAIPLKQLVGLNEVEVAEHGIESPVVVEGKRCVAKLTMVGKELVGKQRAQLFQLVQLLRKADTEVNSRRHDIFQNFYDHNASLHKLFQKSMCCVSELHGQNHDVLLANQHLLQEIFKNVRAAFGSVKDGLEDFMHDLSEHMCNPMVEYVKSLKDEMKHGPAVRMLEIVEEMEKAMRDGWCELEDARKKARVAEEKRIEALCKLETVNDEAIKMKEQLKSLLEAKVLFGMKEEHGTDDKQLQEMVKKKRKHHALDSPMGPEEVLYSADNKSLRLPNRRVTRSMATLGQQTQCSPSPSVSTRSVASYKRINSRLCRDL